MFFCGLFAAVKPATAQTWTQTSAPSNNNWVAVASSADGSKLIAAGMPCIYCISTNSGSTWITNTQPQKGSSYGSWISIASSADGTKLVGISFNTIWASTNSGITWFSNSVPGVSAFISVTLSADGTKLVAVESLNTSPGSIYTSTNLGVTLTQTTAPTNFWTSVASSADGTKLVAAATTSTHGGPIYTSTNSGLTWALTGAPTNIGWQTVASSADGSKLLAGSAVSFTPGLGYGGIYTSTNFGITWTSNHVPAAQWQSVASSADGTKLVAVAIEPRGLIYSSTNSGATWVSNNVPNDGWHSVASSADGNQLVAASIVNESFKPGSIYISRQKTSKVFAICYELKSPGKNYGPFFEAIKNSAKWCHFPDSTWLIYTSETPAEISNQLSPHIVEGDYLLIIEVRKNFNGCLPKEAWNWIDQHVTQQ
jgi:photosystem II stability/assembly factor-like uncharacterized protein